MKERYRPFLFSIVCSWNAFMLSLLQIYIKKQQQIYKDNSDKKNRLSF